MHEVYELTFKQEQDKYLDLSELPSTFVKDSRDNIQFEDLFTICNNIITLTNEILNKSKPFNYVIRNALCKEFQRIAYLENYEISLTIAKIRELNHLNRSILINVLMLCKKILKENPVHTNLMDFKNDFITRIKIYKDVPKKYIDCMFNQSLVYGFEHQWHLLLLKELIKRQSGKEPTLMSVKRDCYYRVYYEI